MDPKHPWKKPAIEVWACNPNTAHFVQGMPGAGHPARVAHLVRIPSIPLPFPTCTHTHEPIHMPHTTSYIESLPHAAIPHALGQ